VVATGRVTVSANVQALSLAIEASAIDGTGLLSAATLDLRTTAGDLGSAQKALQVQITAGGTGLSGQVQGAAWLQQSAGTLVLAGLSIQDAATLVTDAAIVGAASEGMAALKAARVNLQAGSVGESLSKTLVLRTDVLQARVSGPVWLSNQTSLEIGGTGLQVTAPEASLLLDVRGDLAITAAVSTVGGELSLVARGAITQSGGIETQGALVELFALRGSITQAATASLDSGNGNVRLDAGDALALASVKAGTGTVGLVARTGSITDADGHSDDVDVQAAQVLVLAGEDVGAHVLAGSIAAPQGAQANALDIRSSAVAARAAGSLRLEGKPATTLAVSGRISAEVA
jgi:hypothetical protein